MNDGARAQSTPCMSLPTVAVPLPNGLVAIIDAEDAAKIAPYKWRYIRTSGSTPTVKRYIMATTPQNFYLHRLVMGALRGQLVDHIDGDTLNCRKSNLRFVTRAQNARNRVRHENEGRTSKFKGVCWDVKASKWLATICADRVIYRLGAFFSEVEAAMAYDDASHALHGVFGSRNFPEREPRPIQLKAPKKLTREEIEARNWRRAVLIED